MFWGKRNPLEGFFFFFFLGGGKKKGSQKEVEPKRSGEGGRGRAKKNERYPKKEKT